MYLYLHFLGTNGQVTYGGLSEGAFQVDPLTGVLRTTRKLDREMQEDYTLSGNT